MFPLWLKESIFGACAQPLLPEVRTAVCAVYHNDTFLLSGHALKFPFSVQCHTQVRMFKENDKV